MAQGILSTPPPTQPAIATMPRAKRTIENDAPADPPSPPKKGKKGPRPTAVPVEAEESPVRRMMGKMVSWRARRRQSIGGGAAAGATGSVHEWSNDNEDGLVSRARASASDATRPDSISSQCKPPST